MGTRRAFGTTRKHRSGRWGAEYTHPVSRERVLPGKSFATKADSASMARRSGGRSRSGPTPRPQWRQADLRVVLDGMARGSQRSSVQDARPVRLPAAAVSPPAPRRYRSVEVRFVNGPQMARTSQRRHAEFGDHCQGVPLLRQILEAAVDDMLLRSNPCTLKNVAVERSAERSTPTIDEAINFGAGRGPANESTAAEASRTIAVTVRRRRTAHRVFLQR